MNETIVVSEVMDNETAASDIINPIRSGTSNLTDVRRHAANITNKSSIPTPEIRSRINGNFCSTLPFGFTHQRKRKSIKLHTY